MKHEKYPLRRLGLAAAMLALAGCSAMAPASQSTGQASAAGPHQLSAQWGQPPGVTGTRQASAAGPPPLIQNCGLIAISSPSKFVCNGKVYTTFQLAKMREDWEKKHAQ